MNKIVELEFGSHLYGTSTPNSDRDYKAIYIPEAIDILLGHVAYEKVAALIEEGLVNLLEAQKQSVLVDVPDQAWADALVVAVYSKAISDSL